LVDDSIGVTIYSATLTEPILALYEYFDCVDRGDAQAAAEIFTRDARAEVMTGKVLEGRDRIGRALGRILAAYDRTSHHVTNVREERDGERVILRSYVYAYHRLVATGAAWHLWVRLRNVLVPDGDRWLIAEHTLIGVDSTPERREIPEEWYPGHPGRDWGPRPLRGAQARDAIAAANPQAAAGMALLRRARAEGGAIAPAHAALITACAAASRGQPGQVRLALEDALALGLSAEEAWGAPAALLLARGQATAERLAEAVIEVFGAPEQRPPHPGTFDREAAFAYLREVFGEVPERHELLADLSPTAFEGYMLLHRGGLREGTLPPLLVELILCGVMAADAQPAFVQIHANAARRLGATDDDIVQAVVAVMPIAGAGAWPAAAAALSQSA
jgi:alkylhydroperoxidase/carboxymuconolactone decarboxylase family protein YurZ/ketosteroid isomerase-like protein